MTGLSDDLEVLIAVNGPDAAQSSELAGDLAQFLSAEMPGAAAQRQRDDELTQDFGVILAVVLSSTAVTALARGVGAWLQRRRDACLTLRRSADDGQTRELTLRGQPSARTERMVSDFLNK
jgi:hypothetical protein